MTDYIEQARLLSWYCEACDQSDVPGSAVHPIGKHLEGVSWPVRLVTDAPPPRRCWCGRWLPLIGPVCHDPRDIYRCHCGLHLFDTRTDTAAYARHAAHIECTQ